MLYVVKAFMDEYIAIAIPTLQEQLEHVATLVMSGIHGVFPSDHTVDENNPISLKKMLLLEAMWVWEKDILDFGFDG